MISHTQHSRTTDDDDDDDRRRSALVRAALIHSTASEPIVPEQGQTLMYGIVGCLYRSIRCLHGRTICLVVDFVFGSIVL
jgi:hypothetical protein